MINQNDEDTFEDYPQEFIEKMDDMKGKAKKVSVYEHSRFGYDQIESPKGIDCDYDIERRKRNGKSKK